MQHILLQMAYPRNDEDELGEAMLAVDLAEEAIVRMRGEKEAEVRKISQVYDQRILALEKRMKELEARRDTLVHRKVDRKLYGENSQQSFRGEEAMSGVEVGRSFMVENGNMMVQCRQLEMGDKHCAHAGCDQAVQGVNMMRINGGINDEIGDVKICEVGRAVGSVGLCTKNSMPGQQIITRVTYMRRKKVRGSRHIKCRGTGVCVARTDI